MGRCGNAALAGALLALCVAAILSLCAILDYTRPAPPVPAAPSSTAATSPDLLSGVLGLRLRLLLDSAPCGQATAALLAVVSHAGHVAARSAARRACPSSQLAASGARRVFLLAVPRPADPDHVSPQALADEARRFGDLVQADFAEAYRNLSYKHALGLAWAARRCPLARLVLKMDDDVAADLPGLLALLLARDPPPPLQGYLLAGRRPERDPRSKWCVTRAEYPPEQYPAFLSGWLYAATPRVAAELVRRAARLPFFWVDDVLLTGLARRAAGVRLEDVRDLRGLFASHAELLQCCLASTRYQCDFMVGPDGGQPEMLVKFQRHADRCRRLRCPRRPQNESLRRTCVVRRSSAPPERGHALVRPVQLR
ncbi:beta-1,3-galactosyltransferase 5 isoform X2 [Bacillus rossius redtenbacheri]